MDEREARIRFADETCVVGTTPALIREAADGRPLILPLGPGVPALRPSWAEVGRVMTTTGVFADARTTPAARTSRSRPPR